MPGLYLHIPFCTQACSYCDFYFVTQKTLIPAFVEAMCREIRSWKGGFGASPVETIYFGGGTPSVLNREQLEAIFNAIHETFEAETKEITLEANPEHITQEYLKMVCDIGITRLSMGVQSFDPLILSKMHRAHDREQAQKALKLIKDHSVKLQSWSVDLIYGNPCQTVNMLEKDIEQLLCFDPPHISAYSLTLEDRTRLNREVELGRTQMPDQDRVAEHAEFVSQKLKEAGFEHYEVSSYAKPGHRAVHNHRYWNHVEYLGFGPSAHSFLWENAFEGNPIRLSHERDLRSYLTQSTHAGITKRYPYNLESNRQDSSSRDDSPKTDSDSTFFIPSGMNFEKLTIKDLAEERIMMGFRTSDGVTEHELQTRYNYTLNLAQSKWLLRKIEEGLMQDSQHMTQKQGRIIKLTEYGLLIADTLTVDFLSLQI